MFSQDFKELLSAFNEHRVKYLIVGGYAVAIHAQPRATEDLDLFIQPETENAKAVFAALTKFGGPLAGLKPEDFIDPGIVRNCRAVFSACACALLVFQRFDGVHLGGAVGG